MKAINTKKTPPENTNKELTLILDELSHDPDTKLNQMKSLIIVCVAFKMFPGPIVERSIKCLRLYKRQQAIKFVSTVLCMLRTSQVTDTLKFDSVQCRFARSHVNSVHG